MRLRKKELKMKTERELFEAWVKKEHTHIFNGAEQGDNRFKVDIDFMYMAWQASAQREGYKLVPVEINNEIESAMFSSVARGEMPCDIYKSMIEAAVENQP